MRLFGLNIKFKGKSGAPTKRFALNPFNDDYYSPVVVEQWKTQSGLTVDSDLAMSYSAVYGCVKIIAETIASLPLFTYKRLNNGGKKPYPQSEWFKILKFAPNFNWTASSFRETLTAHYLLHGNAYALVEWSKDGRGKGMYILDPRKVTPDIGENGERFYRYRRDPVQPDLILPYWEVFHLQGFSDGGLSGKSVLTYMNEAIGLGKATELFGSTFYNNAAAPAGVLELGPEMDLSDEARDRLKREWARKYGGVANAGSVAILEEGVSWKQIGIPAQDAQFLETRKFQIQDIARFFRVPPHMLADLDRATFSNIEHQSINFISQTMLTHFVRWEQTIARDLFHGDDKLFAEFLVAGLLRGDLTSRYNAYAIGRQWGWLSVNDIRELENMNPIGEEGDVYLAPLNMVDAKKFGEEPISTEEPTTDGAEGQDDGSNDKRFLELVTRNTRDASPTTQVIELSEHLVDYSRVMHSATYVLTNTIGKLKNKESKFLGARDRSEDELNRFYENFRNLATTELEAPVKLALEIMHFSTRTELRENEVAEHTKDLVELVVTSKTTADEIARQFIEGMPSTT